MAKAKMTVNDPDNVWVTLTFTQPLGYWRKLHEQWSDKQYPASDFCKALSEAITRMEKLVMSEEIEVGW